MTRTSSPRRLAAALAAVALAAGGLAVAAAAPRAHASTTQLSLFQDDSLLVYKSASSVGDTLDTLRSLGVTAVRVSLYWRLVAPSPSAKKKPVFNATDPSAYPADNWKRYDTIVRLAKSRGIAVNFNVGGPAPAWASSPTKDDYIDGAFYPHASDFGEFVHALGMRYSGQYIPPSPPKPVTPTPLLPLGGTRAGGNASTAQAEAAASVLPRVTIWSIWNEPNQSHFLAPQWVNHTRKPIEYAPRLYRSLVDVAWTALNNTGHAGDTILIGETAPKGRHTTGPKSSLTPMQFVRRLYCVDNGLHFVTGETAKRLSCPTTAAARAGFVGQHPGLFRASGFAHHPYQFFLPPFIRSRDRDFVAIADIGRLTSALRTIFRRFGVARQLPIYYTEYGYQSRPPDPFGFPYALQAAFINQSEYMAWRNGRVGSYAQFLLVDATDLGGFQTGLIGANGNHKPAFAAFRLPLFIPNATRRSSSYNVWGALRPDTRGTKRGQIQYRPSGGSWRKATDIATTNKRGYFFVRVGLSPGDVRIAWRDPQARHTYYSRTVSVR